MILVYFTVGSTSSGSAFVIAPKLGAKTIFESISLWRWLLPPYFLIRFLDRISHTFVLFKDVTLTWINYLETWLRSDNTSCYYTLVNLNPRVLSKMQRSKCENIFLSLCTKFFLIYFKLFQLVTNDTKLSRRDSHPLTIS